MHECSRRAAVQAGDGLPARRRRPAHRWRILSTDRRHEPERSRHERCPVKPTRRRLGADGPAAVAGPQRRRRRRLPGRRARRQDHADARLVPRRLALLGLPHPGVDPPAHARGVPARRSGGALAAPAARLVRRVRRRLRAYLLDPRRGADHPPLGAAGVLRRRRRADRRGDAPPRRAPLLRGHPGPLSDAGASSSTANMPMYLSQPGVRELRVRESIQARTRLFLTFAGCDLALARPVAAQLRSAGGGLALDYAVPSEPFAAQRSDLIRASLGLRLKRCAATVCRFGAGTPEDDWVRWTLAAAQQLRHPLLGAPLAGCLLYTSDAAD